MKTANILIVDDEENVISALKRELEDFYVLYCAQSADEAFKLLKKNTIDIIISDNKMPGMTGIDFICKTDFIYPDIVKIILTGQSDYEDAQKAINQGHVYQFITKPWNNQKLKIILKNALMQRDLCLKYKDALKKIKEQEKAIYKLESEYPGISDKIIGDQGCYELESYENLSEFMKKYLNF